MRSVVTLSLVLHRSIAIMEQKDKKMACLRHERRWLVWEDISKAVVSSSDQDHESFSAVTLKIYAVSYE